MSIPSAPLSIAVSAIAMTASMQFVHLGPVIYVDEVCGVRYGLRRRQADDVQSRSHQRVRPCHSTYLRTSVLYVETIH